jgi:hypothetical protein
LKTIHDGHAQVQHDQVGEKLPGFIDRLQTIFGFSADRPAILLFQQSTQEAPDPGVVIDD